MISLSSVEYYMWGVPLVGSGAVAVAFSGKYGHILTELTKPQRQILKALDIPILEQSAA